MLTYYLGCEALLWNQFLGNQLLGPVVQSRIKLAKISVNFESIFIRYQWLFLLIFLVTFCILADLKLYKL